MRIITLLCLASIPLLAQGHSVGGEGNVIASGPNNSINVNIQQATSSNNQQEEHQSTFPIHSELKIPHKSSFLDRPEIIKKIAERLKSNEENERVDLVAIIGIGGAGKTTLARKFALTQDAPVVWEINAETRESLVNSFKELAYRLARTSAQKKELKFIQAIQNIEEKERQLLLLVKDWLREKPNWVLIYDNVENLAEMKCYFPEDAKAWGKGKAIITTRDKNIENTTYIKPGNIISIEELNEEEQLTLLVKIIFNCEPDKLTSKEREEAINFLKYIPPFPLDVSLAAYYIKHNGINYNQYLERLSESSQNFEEGQEALLSEVSNYTRTRYGIIASTLRKLIDRHSDFKDLLFLICFLDSQDIPKRLLEFYKGQEITNNFIHLLKRYSLITGGMLLKENGSMPILTFFLHRSTQEIGLTFLKKETSTKKIRDLMRQIINLVRDFYSWDKNRSCFTFITFLPHLESLIKNIEGAQPAKSLKAQWQRDLLMLQGEIHYKCTRNLLSARDCFSRILTLNSAHQILEKKLHATILKYLGDICTETSDLEDSILYCKKSIEIYKKLPNSELFIAENLKTLGLSYYQKNDFKKAKQHFEKALSKLANINYELKKELEAEIYGRLALAYSVRYMNRKKVIKAEIYAFKALEILKFPNLLNSNEWEERPISCQVARLKTLLGGVYCRHGKYQEAVEQGFKVAQHIIKHKLDKCSHNLLRAYILLGIGEALLRKGELIKAEMKLTKSIRIFDRLIGEFANLPARSNRAEARIRLGKFEEAYEDCLSVFTMKKKKRNHYIMLMYIKCFYHAAIIKYKQGNFQKSVEYFSDFFKQIRDFCKGFLKIEEYESLEAKRVFPVIDLKSGLPEDKMKLYLRYSFQIFSIIYGPEHPFVKDYVKENQDTIDKLENS